MGYIKILSYRNTLVRNSINHQHKVKDDYILTIVEKEKQTHLICKLFLDVKNKIVKSQSSGFSWKRILELWKFTAKEFTLKISYEKIDELQAKLLT